MRVYDFLKYTFSIVGAALLLGAFVSYQSTSGFLDEALEVPGEVTELIYDRSGDSSVYYPVVRFNDLSGQSHEFRSSSGSNPAPFSRGEAVSVFFLAEQPQTARINSFFSLWGIPAILGGIGGGFLVAGLLMIAIPLFSAARGAKLKEEGHLVYARFQGVEQNTGVVMNGQSPFRIVTHWQDPSTADLHVFRSANIWFDPTDHIKTESIPVYIRADKPKCYWVDTSFLPKMAS